MPEFRHILRSYPLVKLVDAPKEYRAAQWVSRDLHIAVLSDDATIWERNFTDAELLHAYLQSYDLGSIIAIDPALFSNLETFFDNLKQVSVFFKRGFSAPKEPRATAMASYRQFAECINTTETFVWGVKHYFYNKGLRHKACLNLSTLWWWSREDFGICRDYTRILESRGELNISLSALLVTCLFAIVHGVNADYVFEKLMHRLAIRNKQDERMYEAMLKHFIKEPPTLPGKHRCDAVQLMVSGAVVDRMPLTYKVGEQHNCTVDKPTFGAGETIIVAVKDQGPYSFTLYLEDKRIPPVPEVEIDTTLKLWGCRNLPGSPFNGVGVAVAVNEAAAMVLLQQQVMYPFTGEEVIFQIPMDTSSGILLFDGEI